MAVMGQKAAPETMESSLVADAARIREQLNRLLAHRLFANSKRYPLLLSHVVEQTLLGHADELKERTIGVDIFGKDPSYDSNADPVVRITAKEVRGRLKQYYYEFGEPDELVIDLPTGSYVPLFRERERLPAPTPPEAFALAASAEVLPSRIAAPTPPSRWWRLRWFLSGGIALLLLLAGTAGLFAGLHYRAAPPPPSNTDRFWAPVTGSVNPTTFCLGEPAKNIDVGAINNFDTPVANARPEPLYFRLHYSGNLALADVITLTRTVAALASRHKSFRVVPASEATFGQLREGPFVLIGAFDNIWTLRVTQKLRFGFESKDGVALLVDRNSSTKTTWATAWDLPYQRLSRDYAIVARIHDKTTGQPVIIAAGISEEGTEAAGEILYNPEYLDSLIAKAGRDWDQKNLEAVIETQVIEGHPGPPNILAVETW
jgi:hypothetical protein